MRSIILAIYELNVKEIIVIGHYNCGLHNLDSDKLINKIIQQGVSQNVIDEIQKTKDLSARLKGFDNEKTQILETVNNIKKHPLVPNSIIVHGGLIDPTIGKITKLI